MKGKISRFLAFLLCLCLLPLPVFADQEVQAASDAGMQICSLGPRILRCETAPLCALSALMYAADELS